jgi:GTPase SAR1 family protein
MNAIREHASKDCNKILLGNKVDVPGKAISSERGSAVASEFDVTFFETSAKTGHNVDLAFQSVARDCVMQALAASGVDMADGGAGSGADGDGKGGKRCEVM